MINILEARREIVKYSHKVQQYGYVSATDGNLSIRLDENHALITPSGLEKGEMTLEALIIVDMEGSKLEGSGSRKRDLLPIHAHPTIIPSLRIKAEMIR